ncbi:MAG: DUF2892 domain-containing protein, partial [Schleiferiaceae bacterium]|nr:DUF2892 domain-containing protein [Schleiferiaceae bacterium]
MLRKYLRLSIGILVIATAVWQFTAGELGNGLFLLFMSLFPILFHFRNERILIGLWHMRKQDMVKLGIQLDAIKYP